MQLAFLLRCPTLTLRNATVSIRAAVNGLSLIFHSFLFAKVRLVYWTPALVGENLRSSTLTRAAC